MVVSLLMFFMKSSKRITNKPKSKDWKWTCACLLSCLSRIEVKWKSNMLIVTLFEWYKNNNYIYSIVYSRASAWKPIARWAISMVKQLGESLKCSKEQHKGLGLTSNGAESFSRIHLLLHTKTRSLFTIGDCTVEGANVTLSRSRIRYYPLRVSLIPRLDLLPGMRILRSRE